ncbi:MAG: hypothetical protein QHG99_02810 [Methanomicrobiales archaeon]|nr:hypothetical protein [Methanomicrobiales archaeon]
MHMVVKRPPLQVKYRVKDSDEIDISQEFFLTELTDQSIRNIKRIITTDSLSCTSLKERICWNPSNLVR